MGGSCRQREVTPAGCSFQVTLDNDTYSYQFDDQGRVTHMTLRSARSDVDYRYAYQPGRATIDITYPRSDWLRIHYDLTLNAQGYVLTAQETMTNRLADGTMNSRMIGDYTCTYDGEDYLTTYRYERYSYPVSSSVKTLAETLEAKLSYQDGNPVTVTYVGELSGRVIKADTMVNQYGTQPNATPFSWLLEANPFSFSPSMALRPLLGKPSRRLITNSELKGTINMTTTYSYQLNAQGQLVQASRAGNSAPFRLSFANGCP